MARTFAMRVYAASYGVLTLAFAYILGFVLLPAMNSSPDVAAFVPVLGVFLALFVLCGVLAAFLPSAPRRRWFWLVALLPAILFLLMNAPYLPYSASHPADNAFPATVPLLLWTVVLVVAGFTAFREVGAPRAAEPGGAASSPGTGAPGGRARWAIAILVGLTVGVSGTGSLVLAQGGGGTTLAAAPTTSATLVAEGTKYLTTSYRMTSSGVLGLFVENRDATAHSFDIDALNIHVAIPANATVVVAIKPGNAGALDFYCSIPGHREAGMAGTIQVD